MTTRCRHVDVIKDELRRCAATDIRAVSKGKRVRVSFTLGGRRATIVVSTHPRDDVAARKTGCQRARRALQAALSA